MALGTLGRSEYILYVETILIICDQKVDTDSYKNSLPLLLSRDGTKFTCLWVWVRLSDLILVK